MSARLVGLNLADLELPAVIEPLDYETIRSTLIELAKLRFEARGVPYDVDALETDPVVIVCEAFAFRELSLRARINDAAKAVMLATATGTDLENFAADLGVKRLIVKPATDSEPAVYETDEEMRERRRLAPDALAAAGPAESYSYFAMTADTSIKEAVAVKGIDNRVDLILLSKEGTGFVPTEVVSKVHDALSPFTTRPLTASLFTRSASIVSQPISVTITVPLGPDRSLVAARAKAGIELYAAERHAIGQPLRVDGIIGAARCANAVEKVTVVTPAADVDPGAFGAVHVPTVIVTVVS